MGTTNYITDKVKALIGYETEWMEAYDQVETGAMRRHIHASMDEDPVYWNEEIAARTRYKGIVAPPMFPLHAFRRPSGTPDPLDRVSKDFDYDCASRDFGLGLAPVPIPLPRIMNGGNRVEVYQLARPGERIRAKSKYLDIYQKEGRSGVLVFVIFETLFCNQKGEKLLKAIQTLILR